MFTVCVETITVVSPSVLTSSTYANKRKFCWGPLSCLAAVSILNRSHSRHFYQIIVCTAHLYGVALYYATNWADFRASGVSYSRPEFLYYWVYYVGFNMPWAVVPFGKICCATRLASCCAAANHVQCFYTIAGRVCRLPLLRCSVKRCSRRGDRVSKKTKFK